MDVQMGSERASGLPKVTQQSPVQCPIHAFFAALADAIHFSPERSSQASVPSCRGGLGQEMEQSLEIFIEGINKEVAEVLPGSGPHPLAEPRPQ